MTSSSEREAGEELLETAMSRGRHTRNDPLSRARNTLILSVVRTTVTHNGFLLDTRVLSGNAADAALCPFADTVDASAQPNTGANPGLTTHGAARLKSSSPYRDAKPVCQRRPSVRELIGIVDQICRPRRRPTWFVEDSV